MTDTYIDLVNKLRRRFNEAELTTTTWPTTVGFDQFTKEAINYAYHDIINAEMEWPFLHQQGIVRTIPGIQFYTANITVGDQLTSNSGENPTEIITNNDPTQAADLPINVPGNFNGELKEIDYESFYIADNNTVATINDELQTISGSFPYTATPNNLSTWRSDFGVAYNSNGIYLAPVTNDPRPGEYSIVPGRYYVFNAADAGKVVKLTYGIETAATQANIINAQNLTYLDYDQWRQALLPTDINALAITLKTPQYVIKTQEPNKLGFSPVPDKIYYIWFEYWADVNDLVATTDAPALPLRYYQIILDGASKYCYEFREDPQQAQMADARFKAGIQRMRVELINRQNDMKTGIYWYPHGYSYTLNTLR